MDCLQYLHRVSECEITVWREIFEDQIFRGFPRLVTDLENFILEIFRPRKTMSFPAVNSLGTGLMRSLVIKCDKLHSVMIIYHYFSSVNKLTKLLDPSGLLSTTRAMGVVRYVINIPVYTPSLAS